MLVSERPRRHYHVDVLTINAASERGLMRVGLRRGRLVEQHGVALIRGAAEPAVEECRAVVEQVPRARRARRKGV